MLYAVEDIRQVHLEISSECNAICPQCPRNLCGYPHNDGYEEHSMTVAEAQKIFTPAFLNQIDQIAVNGNFGDVVMCPDAVSIFEYFKQHMQENANLTVSTNGGARDRVFWTRLAELDVMVHFCIDGLEDTHSIYRRNTVYSTVIRNAQTFIAAGGRATWKMIDFDHSRHQQAQAQQLSKEMGFKEFQLIDHGRNIGPIFDSNKKLVFVMGTPDHTDFDVIYEQRARTDAVADVAGCPEPIKTPIACEAIANKGIYINSIGEVYPCCYLGFNPRTYGHGSDNYLNVVNTQLRPLVSRNSALEHTMAECIEWFDQVEQTWSKPSYAEGRLVACNNMCGGCKQ
jgi:sulfatase maturation enzyme AslB (radical SAM superfamily)